MKTTTLLLALSLTAAVASAKVSDKFTQTYPLDANGSLHLENVNGSVEIVAWDKPEVALEAEKVARSQEGLDRMHLKIEVTARHLHIKTEYEKKWKFWDNMNAQVHYKLKVPAGIALDRIEVVNADIHVTGVQGAVRLESVNGSIEAAGLTGPGKFETVNGSVRAEYAALPASGDISLETVNGTCKIIVPAKAAFDLDADTVNGRVSCDLPITLEKSGRHEVRGSVNGGGVRLKLESVNGSLSVDQHN